jgi:argininosuccinate lyase
MKKNILRGSRVKRSSKRANDYISSIGFDSPIAKQVVSINVAHMLSLLKSKEVEDEVGNSCLGFLLGLPKEIQLDAGTEDVHHMIEQDAIAAIGIDRAGYMNLGKSRNDQVATALRMETRARLLDLAEALTGVQSALVSLMRTQGRLAMPGYTHLQHAQPVTVAHHLQGYVEALQRDFDRIVGAYRRVNLSPMGAAALAGTSVRIDRDYVAFLLGFEGLAKNAMDAVSSRDFALESLSVATIAMVNLSRFAEELILWSSQEFGFVEIADEYSATSSIMPQKKNPVVAETIRAKCGSVMGELTAALAITKALPNSYNLDLQEVTPHLWRGMSDATESASMMQAMLSSVRFNKRRLESALKDDKSTATELANVLTRAHGVPFRQSHAIVGQLVRIAVDEGRPLEVVVAAKLPEISKRVTGRAVKIDKVELGSTLDALKTLRMNRSAGGANPLLVPRLLSEDSGSVERNSSWIVSARGSLVHAEERLMEEARRATGVRTK